MAHERRGAGVQRDSSGIGGKWAPRKRICTKAKLIRIQELEKGLHDRGSQLVVQQVTAEPCVGF